MYAISQHPSPRQDTISMQRSSGCYRCLMQTNSAGFLESVDHNFRHAMSFLDLPEGLAEGIIQCNSTYTVRFVCACAVACTASSAGARCTVSTANRSRRDPVCIQCRC